MSLPETDVAIIGSGPYALSLATQLTQRGVEHRIFGPPMKFWRDMPAGINLKSYAWATNLYPPSRGYGFAEWCRARSLEDHEPCSMASFAAYGVWFQERLVPELEPVEVRMVRRTGDGRFELTLQGGEQLRAWRVVFATGLSDLAEVPELLRALPPELYSHTSQHPDYGRFAKRSVAVIGAGASAVEAGALIHEAGGTAEVLIRGEQAIFNTLGPRTRPLLERIKRPDSVLGPGRNNWILANLPLAVHFVPEEKRVPFVQRAYGPVSPWWIRDRVEGIVPLRVRTEVVAAKRVGERVALTLREGGAGERTLVVDHVVAGTGYAFDVDRLSYLDAGFKAGIDRVVRAPRLSMNFESSVEGAYFLGPITALSFGPLFRFVSGAESATPRVARHLASPLREVRRGIRRQVSRGGLEALRQGGVSGLKSWAGDQLYWRFDPWVRQWSEELPRQQRLDEEFDRRYGVETAGQVELAQVGIAPAEVARGGSLYRPVWTGIFHSAVQAIPADLSQFTFLDYGSGKGKALLLASDYPFEEIVGVEFARPLHEIAERNLLHYQSPGQRCRALRSVCGDAMRFEPPEKPLVCFFFNPFDDASMSVVLENLRSSEARVPRPVFVCYCNARNVREHEAVFSSRPFLVEEARTTHFLVYRVRSA